MIIIIPCRVVGAELKANWSQIFEEWQWFDVFNEADGILCGHWGSLIRDEMVKNDANNCWWMKKKYIKQRNCPRLWVITNQFMNWLLLSNPSLHLLITGYEDVVYHPPVVVQENIKIFMSVPIKDTYT